MSLGISYVRIASRTFFILIRCMKQADRIQYKLMLTPDLKKRLEHAAVEAHRSLSAEINLRLEDSLRKIEAISDDPQKNELVMLEIQLRQLEAEHMHVAARRDDIGQRLAAIRAEIASRAAQSKADR